MKLVIAEKPSVAKSIADVLGAKDKKDGYIEGNEYIVSWCVGHLIELATPESYDESLRKWSYDTLPIVPDKWQYDIKTETKAQYNVLKKLMNDSRISTIICGTDVGQCVGVTKQIQSKKDFLNPQRL